MISALPSKLRVFLTFISMSSLMHYNLKGHDKFGTPGNLYNLGSWGLEIFGGYSTGLFLPPVLGDQGFS